MVLVISSQTFCLSESAYVGNQCIGGLPPSWPRSLTWGQVSLARSPCI